MSNKVGLLEEIAPNFMYYEWTFPPVVLLFPVRSIPVVSIYPCLSETID